MIQMEGGFTINYKSVMERLDFFFGDYVSLPFCLEFQELWTDHALEWERFCTIVKSICGLRQS